MQKLLLLLFVIGLFLVGCVDQLPQQINIKQNVTDTGLEEKNQKEAVSLEINKSLDRADEDIVEIKDLEEITDSDVSRLSIRERQALEDNEALRCTDYYEVYTLYFLDIKQELKDFQQRYLNVVGEYKKGNAEREAVEKAEWKMKEKEVVYLKVQDAFRRLNEECNKPYYFDDISELFIETKQLSEQLETSIPPPKEKETIHAVLEEGTGKEFTVGRKRFKVWVYMVDEKWSYPQAIMRVNGMWARNEGPEESFTFEDGSMLKITNIILNYAGESGSGDKVEFELTY